MLYCVLSSCSSPEIGKNHMDDRVVPMIQSKMKIFGSLFNISKATVTHMDQSKHTNMRTGLCVFAD